MAREREVKVTVLGDSSSGQRALAQLDDRADKTGNHFDGLGHKMVSFGKVAALGLAGAAVGVGAFLKSSVEAAEESRKVMAQTDAVIKSTGGVARVTAKDVDALSSSLSAMSGVDDEVIAGGQNLLLTFTNVRNAVGKGNDIFNQGTKAALNMSVALGTDMNSASMLVGKALNDPIKGMTALTRSGITFTEQQKDQVKAMVAAGDTLGAQKVILKELETQFGGSAAAAASPMARLKVVVGNLQEELGARLLPILGKVAGFLADKLPGAIDKVTGLFSGLFNLFAKGDYTGELGKALGIEEDSPIIDTMFKIRDAIMGAVDDVVGWVRKNWPEIKKIITETLKTVQAVVKGVVDVITTIWRNFGDQIKAVIAAAWTYVKSTIEAALKVIQGIVKVVTSLIHGDWSGVWEGIKMILAGAWDFIMARVQFAIDIVKAILSTALEIISAAWSSVWNGIKNFFAGVWDRIFQLARDGVANIVDTFLGMVGLIIGAAESAFGWIPGIGGKLRDAKDKFDEFRDGVNRALRGIEDRTVYVTVVTQGGDERTYGGEIGGRTSPGIQLAKGGIVNGPTMALIGEAGRELVLPLTDMSRTAQLLSQAGLLSDFGGAVGPAVGGGSGGNVYVTIGTLVGSDGMRELAEIVRSEQLKYQRRVPTLGYT